jgi:hypothetical protein
VRLLHNAGYKYVTRYYSALLPGQPDVEATMSEEGLKRLICLGCGFMYDAALGLPEHGIAPGTRWADIPDY